MDTIPHDDGSLGDPDDIPDTSRVFRVQHINVLLFNLSKKAWRMEQGRRGSKVPVKGSPQHEQLMKVHAETKARWAAWKEDNLMAGAPVSHVVWDQFYLSTMATRFPHSSSPAPGLATACSATAGPVTRSRRMQSSGSHPTDTDDMGASRK